MVELPPSSGPPKCAERKPQPRGAPHGCPSSRLVDKQCFPPKWLCKPRKNPSIFSASVASFETFGVSQVLETRPWGWLQSRHPNSCRERPISVGPRPRPPARWDGGSEAPRRGEGGGSRPPAARPPRDGAVPIAMSGLRRLSPAGAR